MRKLAAADSAASNEPGRVPLKFLLDTQTLNLRPDNIELSLAFRHSCAMALMDPRLTAGSIGDFDTGTLLEILYAPAQVPGIAGFWLNYFDQTVNSDTQEIRFDSVDLNEYRLAPFVAPNVQGRVLRGTGFDVKTFRPAYIKAKHVVDPSRAIPRQPGEAPYGSLSLQARFDAIVADNMRRERLVIENRWDWMACKAIVDAAITISGEDYPTTTIDFKRDPSLSATMAGSTTWDQTTATVMSDIKYMRSKSFRLSRSPVRNLVFGPDAWDAFILNTHADVQILLQNSNFVRGSESNFNRLGVQSGSPYEWQGSISGPAGGGLINLWLYSNEFEDNGIFYSYLDTGTVVGIGDNVKGIRAFGAIMDKRAGLLPVDMFPKMWDEEDPSVTYTMTQSAPLMIPLRPNNSFKMKVVANTGLYP